MGTKFIWSCVIVVSLFLPMDFTARAKPSATVETKTAPKHQRPVILTGTIVAGDSQSIFVPPSNSSPVNLRSFVAEGTHVKKGDLLLRIESPNGSNLEQLQISIDQTRSRMELDVAKLEVAAFDAEKILVTAKAALGKARVDAALPKIQISAIDFDKYQTELDRSQRDLEVRQRLFDDALASVKRRLSDGELELKKQEISLAFAKAELSQSEVLAKQDGIVVHGFNSWRGERYEEGSSAFPGNMAGQVMGAGAMQVEAMAIEADRPFLDVGMAVEVAFDALPGMRTSGKISSITSAPEVAATWGKGRYFRVAVQLPEKHGVPLVAGMSVSVEPGARTRTTSKGQGQGSDALVIEGDVLSRINLPVSPPTIRYVWQYTLAQIAPEGSLIKKGEQIATFQAAEVATKLDTQRSALHEKQRTYEKFKLEQTEADKANDLAVQEAQANAEKAARKATMPKELIRRVDYEKLVIERGLSAEVAELVVRQRVAQGRARKAERKNIESEIAQLQSKIDDLTRGMQALKVNATRDGMVIYKTNFNGEKFAPGSRVFVGLSVAMLADPDKLYVLAKVPEAQAAQVFVGQKSNITVPGSGQVLSAHVSGLGNIYHAKSSAQPIIIRDVELEFEKPPKDIKPGSAVQATLPTSATIGKDALAKGQKNVIEGQVK